MSRPAITLALVFVATGLGAYASYERVQNSALSSNIQNLQKQLADRSKATAFANQQRCAQRAAFLFKDLGYDNAKQMASFESHFSDAHNKCIIKVGTSSNDLSWSAYTVLDAFDQREYASYFAVMGKAPRTMVCSLSFPGIAKVTCTSQEQFDEGIRPYME